MKKQDCMDNDNENDHSLNAWAFTSSHFWRNVFLAQASCHLKRSGPVPDAGNGGLCMISR